MSGIIPGLALINNFDNNGVLMRGGLLRIFEAGTNDPAVAYSDNGLTDALPWPVVADSAGRLPICWLADGVYRVRLSSANGGYVAYDDDNIPTLGEPSGGGGGGGGGTVDATTILQTGDMKARYGTGALAGFVRANGLSLGPPTSGATERANNDVRLLFAHFWTADPNLTVLGGRGVSAEADWAAGNKTIATPDLRGRALAFLDDMGNTAAGRLGGGFFTSPTTLGASGGSQSRTLLTANLPPYTPAGSIDLDTPGRSYIADNLAGQATGTATSGYWLGGTTAPLNLERNPSYDFVGTAQGGTSTAFATLPPMMLATLYIKL